MAELYSRRSSAPQPLIRSVQAAVDMLAESGPALGARMRIIFDSGDDLRQIA